eukprot:jgi/Bigna1/146547/aug1.116_g21255
MRRSPAGMQREAASRAAFCDFFAERQILCTPGFAEFNLDVPNQDSIYNLSAKDSTNNYTVSYLLESESSARGNTDLTESLRATIRMILDFLVVAFIGPNSSSASASVSPLAEIFDVPHISYASTSTELSNSEQFPYFFRTVPQDDGQADAIIQFAQAANWQSIAIFNTLDSYGSAGAQELQIAANRTGITINTQQEIFSGETSQDIITSRLIRIRDSLSRIIVIFMLEEDAARVLDAAQRLGIIDVGLGLIGFEPRSTYTNPEFIQWLADWSQIYNVPGGIITNFRNHSLSGFYEFLPPGTEPINYNAFGSQFDQLTPFAYDAMTVLLTAVESLSLQGISEKNLKKYGREWNHRTGTQQNMKFFIIMVEYSYCCQQVMITPSIELFLLPITPDIYEYKAYRATWPTLAAVGFVFVFTIIALTFRKRDDKVMNVGHLMLLSVIFSLFNRPTDSSCQAAIVFGHLGFFLSMGSLLVKNYAVAKFFYNPDNLNKVDMTDRELFLYMMVGVGFASIYLLLWGTIDPIRSSTNPDPADDMVTRENKNVFKINLYLGIVVIELLVLVSSVILAWFVRKAPSDYNESKAIGATMYATTFVVIVILTAFLAVRSTPDIAYALLSIGILISVASMQGFINGPKFSGVENVLDFGDVEEEKKSYMHLERRRLVSKLVRDNTSAELAILIYENKRRIQELEVEKRELSRRQNAAEFPSKSHKSEAFLLPQD